MVGMLSSSSLKRKIKFTCLSSHGTLLTFTVGETGGLFGDWRCAGVTIRLRLVAFRAARAADAAVGRGVSPAIK